MEILLKDTIAAISTPAGYGAIGIVRMSGSRSKEILESIFIPAHTRKDMFSSHQLIRGTIYDGDEAIDEVLAVYMPDKRSYTGEAMVEIHAHGNPFILSEILKLVTQKGARLAQAGEFTFRAFMQGKIDLVQAEAIAELIQAKSKRALSLANKQLRGEFSREIEEIRGGLLDMLAHTEAAIDFSTEDIDVLSREAILQKTGQILDRIKKILNSYTSGRIISQGAQVVIAGRPNVGKSSLLNALINSNRAIVTEEAGTTRDPVEEVHLYKGVAFRFIDTAGIHATENRIEKLGIERSYEKIEAADFILLVLDVSQPIQADERQLLDQVASKNSIVVINKIDLERKLIHMNIQNEYPELSIQEISALTHEGVDALMEAIYQKTLTEHINTGGVFLTKLRHKLSLELAARNLENYKQGMLAGNSLEFLAIDLRGAIEQLEYIIGRIDTEMIYDKIFSSFCIGK